MTVSNRSRDGNFPSRIKRCVSSSNSDGVIFFFIALRFNLASMHYGDVGRGIHTLLCPKSWFPWFPRLPRCETEFGTNFCDQSVTNFAQFVPMTTNEHQEQMLCFQGFVLMAKGLPGSVFLLLSLARLPVPPLPHRRLTH